MNKYAQYFALESKMKKMGQQVNRAELIADFTDGKKSGLSDLTDWEYKEFLKALQSSINQVPTSAPKPDWQNSPENIMRRKIISLFVHKMNYTMQSLDNWCITHGAYHKKLQDHLHDELVVLVTQAEKVHKSFMKSMRR